MSIPCKTAHITGITTGFMYYPYLYIEGKIFNPFIDSLHSDVLAIILSWSTYIVLIIYFVALAGLLNWIYDKIKSK